MDQIPTQEVERWLKILGVPSLIALVTIALGMLKWLKNWVNDPLRKENRIVRRRLRYLRKTLKKESFDLRTILTTNLRKLMDLENRIEETMSGQDNLQEDYADAVKVIRTDIRDIKDSIFGIRKEFGERIAHIEGEMKHIRAAVNNKYKNGTND